MSIVHISLLQTIDNKSSQEAIKVNKDRSQCQCQYHLNADLATKDCKVLEGFIPEAPPKALNTFDKALTKA